MIDEPKDENEEEEAADGDAPAEETPTATV